MNTAPSSPGRQALQRFRCNRWAVAGLIFLLLATVLSVFVPWMLAIDV